MTPSASDHDLLHQFALHRSEAAFTELVRRHLDLVFSAAQRQLGSSALAADVAQSVFLDLARHATRLTPATPLVAWLHVVTRRTAIDVLRAEDRRRAREQSAAELAAMNASAPSSWSAIAPLLDEALDTLGPPDRAAVLLRYFENKSLQEVGAALGTTDDAAQKRLTRALEKLRACFARRGLAVTAAALATDLSAHAIQSAPAALGATISALATAPATALTVSSTAHLLAMTTAQKFLVAATLAVALGGGLFEARVIYRQRATLHDLGGRVATLQAELDSVHADRDARARAFADAQEELQKLRTKTAAFTAADPAVEAALDSWLQNVVRLKKLLEKNPASQIPELQFLTAKDWLDATKETPLDTDLDVRRALRQLRIDGKQHFADRFVPALERYLKANHRQPPADPAQLAPFFESPIDPAILQRYGTVFSKDPADGIPFTAEDGTPVQWTIREKQAVDPYYDYTFQFSSSGYGFGGQSQFDKEVFDAIKSYRVANNNAAPTAPAQLTPYLHSAIDPAFVQKKIDGKD